MVNIILTSKIGQRSETEDKDNGSGAAGSKFKVPSSKAAELLVPGSKFQVPGSKAAELLVQVWVT